jgi:hypothetical protein
MWLRVDRRWLPTWLPKHSLAVLMFEYLHTASRARGLRVSIATRARRRRRYADEPGSLRG